MDRQIASMQLFGWDRPTYSASFALPFHVVLEGRQFSSYNTVLVQPKSAYFNHQSLHVREENVFQAIIFQHNQII